MKKVTIPDLDSTGPSLALSPGFAKACRDVFMQAQQSVGNEGGRLK
ncbi:hypothetical protein BN1012_Phect815 [Candidatus Phaeomarinobacter ectocarpi]|uniref:Uncharacterized protein n=1 Tax=Candidatus Phaeomarinibacter ectocarpi TaxID=1458461 RepID=X5ME41_9HYPH|nr:hypothetical protein BN1012_Phect815 [Candidatus Phaeomarinobacter ectocarpi]